MMDIRQEVGRLAVEYYFEGMSVKEAVKQAAEKLNYKKHLSYARILNKRGEINAAQKKERKKILG